MKKFLCVASFLFVQFSYGGLVEKELKSLSKEGFKNERIFSFLGASKTEYELYLIVRKARGEITDAELLLFSRDGKDSEKLLVRDQSLLGSEERGVQKVDLPQILSRFAEWEEKQMGGRQKYEDYARLKIASEEILHPDEKWIFENYLGIKALK